MSNENNPKLTDATLRDFVAALLAPQLIAEAEKSAPQRQEFARKHAGERAYHLAEVFLTLRPKQ